jgi:hypothetical protein
MGPLPLLAVLALASSFDQTHKPWSDILSACFRSDGFDYKRLKEDRSKLDAYLGSLEAVMPEEFAGWKREQQFAFWIDAFNAYTVKRVVDAYPIASIQDLGDKKQSVWDQEFVPLGKLFPEAGDRKLSLDEIENKILRPKFKDARVHAAIHRASRGSPPLLGEAFTAEKLDRQLDAQVERWLGDPERNRFDHKSSSASLSKIFDWYKEDFVREADSVRRWLEKHAPAAEREWLSSAKELKIEFLDYSWKLDDAR